jgi:CelD/BcsL family acetyltransferase involved in cellulose biosynthesis
MVSLELGGAIRAVDLGAVYNGVYTVFLGGTDAGFPGVAKVMNMHHIEYALEQRLFKVDFLCGDFHWKKLWHLDAEPLYKYVTVELPIHDEPGFTLADETSDMVQIHV